jgi:hypothetical protein
MEVSRRRGREETSCTSGAGRVGSWEDGGGGGDKEDGDEEGAGAGAGEVGPVCGHSGRRSAFHFSSLFFSSDAVSFRFPTPWFPLIYVGSFGVASRLVWLQILNPQNLSANFEPNSF